MYWQLCTSRKLNLVNRDIFFIKPSKRMSPFQHRFNRFNTLWFPLINIFSVKKHKHFLVNSKINAKIIIVQWFLSTQHPSSYEMVRSSGKKLLIRECFARRAKRVMWHNCPSRCWRPIGMKKLSYKPRCKLTWHAHVFNTFTGHKQRFVNTHVTRSLPTGIAKLSEVLYELFFMIKWYIKEVFY